MRGRRSATDSYDNLCGDGHLRVVCLDASAIIGPNRVCRDSRPAAAQSNAACGDCDPTADSNANA
jgi:hypothetical protein